MLCHACHVHLRRDYPYCLHCGTLRKGAVVDSFAAPELRWSDAAGERVYPLVKPVTTIGRSPDNDIVLDDASVSRHHARVVRNAEGFHLEDLNSFNGTTIGRPHLPRRLGPAARRVRAAHRRHRRCDSRSRARRRSAPRRWCAASSTASCCRGRGHRGRADGHRPADGPAAAAQRLGAQAGARHARRPAVGAAQHPHRAVPAARRARRVPVAPARRREHRARPALRVRPALRRAGPAPHRAHAAHVRGAGAGARPARPARGRRSRRCSSGSGRRC